MRTRQKQKIIIGVLCSIVIGLTIGYALLSQTLNINGTSEVTADWRIEITDVQTKTIMGNAKNTTEPTYDKLTANMSASFEKPGDSITYDVTVSNLGNIDAVLDSIKMNMEEQEYIDFKVEGITAREELISKEHITFQLTIKFSENVTEIPSNPNFDFSMDLNYLQSGNSSNFSEADTDTKDTLSINGLRFEPGENSIKTIIDATNAIKYYYSLDNNKWYETTSNEYTIYQLDANKEYTIYVKAEDSLGNVVFSFGKTTTIDQTKPKIIITEGNNVKGNNGWYKGLTLDSTITDNVGVKEVTYCETTETSCEPSKPLEGHDSIYSVNLSSNTLPTRLCVKAVDTSNNSSTQCSDRYKIDSNVPTISNFNVTPNDDTVTLEVTGVDNESGIVKYYYSKDGGQNFIESTNSNYTFTSLEEKDYLMSVYVEDSAGNKSEISTKSTTIKHKSWCERNGYTDLAECLIASETKSANIDTAKQAIKDKGTPDFTKSAPAIIYEERIGNNTETTSISTYWEIATSYTFDPTTGYFRLVNSSIQDPSSIDYSSGNYYTCNSTSYTCEKMYRVLKVNTIESDDGDTIYKGTAYGYTAELKNYDNSGTGMYASTDDFGDTYYYRGAVGGNYVKFAGYYWRIIRVNGDGSIRMIYDGKTPHENGEGSSDRQVETSAFNNQWKDNANVGYMYGDGSDNVMQETNTVYLNGGLNPTTKYVFGSSYTYDKESKMFKLSGNLIQTTLLEYKEKYSSLQYYSCWSNNESEGCPVLFRISDECKIDEQYKETVACQTNIGFASSSYEKAHTNTLDSTIKSYLDNWYDINLTSYTNKLSNEAVYCNNRVPSTLKSDLYQQEGYGIYPTTYDYEKFINWQGTRSGPELACKRTNDMFSVSNSSGNGKLTKAIGLITADEVNMAGGRTSAQNSLYYLYSGTDFWTMSPSDVDVISSANIFEVQNNGSLNRLSAITNAGIRPVINLDSTKITFTGTGTMQDPYIIE